MKITTIFAMGKNGEMGTDSQANHFLPWARNTEDMAFLKAKLDELGLQNNSVGMSVLVATYATYNLLPASMRRIIEHRGYKVILLTSDIHKKADEKYSILTMGDTIFLSPRKPIEQGINNEQFAKKFKGALSLVVEPSTVENLLYLGSPQFTKEMMGISDKTFITVFEEVLDVKITHELGQLGLQQVAKRPRKKIQTIENGYIMEVASKCYNI